MHLYELISLMCLHLSHNSHQKTPCLLHKQRETLVKTSIVFRHGNKVPELDPLFPNYPYKDTTFFPYNHGDLTFEGQKTLYDVGKGLRERYNSFLGEKYYANLVHSVSSSYQRCQMSMQALHTGLFGGLNSVPIEGIQWQAIPYYTVPFDEDRLLSVHVTCPAILWNITYPDVAHNSDETNLVLNTLKQHGGLENPTYFDALRMYDVLISLLEQGLPVPDELKSIFPDSLRKVAALHWGFATEQTLGVIGPLLKRITENALEKSTNTLVPSNRKMFLYSGHDLNIHYLLRALNVFQGEEVVYGAHLIFELHDYGKDNHAFKVFLQNGYPEPRRLSIPGCGTLCPLSHFVKLTDALMHRKVVCE